MKHWIAAITLGIVALATPSQALILHEDSDAPSVHPTDSIVGQWSGNGSCVAIGRSDWDYTDYVITTRHQGGGVGTTVTFGGVDYKVAEQWLAPQPWPSEPPPPADLRIVRLETMDGDRANLSNFAQWHVGSSETNDAIVVSGFGKGRGTSGSDTYGTYYIWDGTNNNTQRWGSNTTTGSADNVVAVTPSGTYTSDTLLMTFGSPADKDCGMAEWDSGGGWFMDTPGPGTNWELVALSAYVPNVEAPPSAAVITVTTIQHPTTSTRGSASVPTPRGSTASCPPSPNQPHFRCWLVVRWRF